MPGALPGEPHVELDPAPPGARADRAVDYEFDQRPRTGFARGDHVFHPSLGDGVVVSCEGSGRDAKVTVRFPVGEKRVLARFLRAPGGFGA
jgi:hypothetical protein